MRRVAGFNYLILAGLESTCFYAKNLLHVVLVLLLSAFRFARVATDSMIAGR